MILASEDEIDGPFGDIDLLQKMTVRGVDEDLASRDVDVAVGVGCDAFAAAFGEEFEGAEIAAF